MALEDARVAAPLLSRGRAEVHRGSRRGSSAALSERRSADEHFSRPSAAQAADESAELAALAPAILHLASEGDDTARKLVQTSAKPLLDLAVQVATKLFPATPLDSLSAGLSGPILTHPEVFNALAPRSPLPLVPITTAPIHGVHQLLTRA